ncbi:MAG: DUF3551 domain-containing protein [Bradyrhizobium sp.]|uniref:DUF3551 domain-containing protein n=1 Tax=Bradyrhizobium sp. TaxID=376 RepID=UPI001D2BD3DD|nr:DUF3551 domain-containing protein [Bradyrhizobium sp.]MBV9560727.1 DUF3551 domain-containing protein [Bradyrhizobium sp.]
MRALTSASVVVGTLLLVIHPGSAQTYDPSRPICMHVYGEQMGERMDCIYTSLAECAATASGLPAQCLVNPYYAPEQHRLKRRARSTSRQ